MFRIIHLSKDSKEQLIITEDMDVPAEDHCAKGWEVTSDKKFYDDLASGFPTDYTFTKED